MSIRFDGWRKTHLKHSWQILQMKMGLVFLFLPCLNSLDAAAQTECNTLNVSLKSLSLQDNLFLTHSHLAYIICTSTTCRALRVAISLRVQLPLTCEMKFVFFFFLHFEFNSMTLIWNILHLDVRLWFGAK